MTNSFSSSSSPPMMLSPKKYDVFLSFRGEDTRNNITSHLREALIQKKVETYIDYKLEKGEGIGPSLITAIEESHVSVVIFSENYASSKWCLDEIAKIIECKKDLGQIVIPVFYKIDPSHVRKQTGTYEKWFDEHIMNNNSPKVFKWRTALTEAANLAGWDFQTYRSESDFIKDIVKDILRRLNLVHPIELKGVVGIEENYEGIISLMEMTSTEVRVIGLWGMGGIGKTTLAIALHAKLFSQFEGHCFLANVKEQSEKNSIEFLRHKLFSDLLEEENVYANYVPKVEYHSVTNRLRRKKVLIVLDNVTTSEQLEDLINDYDCFGPGSRVIVTTRDKHIINNVGEIYEVKELNKQNSLQLFCFNAFKEKHPPSGYEELSESVIVNCNGNPLALKVLGARLRSRSKEIWKSELEKLKKIQDKKIHNVLKLSYDDLDSDAQNIFLDIAFFVKGEYRDHVTSLLEACAFFPGIGIEVLVEKCLVTISKKGTIEMHDLIQEMGWNVVYQESIKDPGSRSRLWDPKEVYDVLKYNKGTESVEGISLNVCKIEDLHLSSNSFAKMSEMRFLKFYYGKCNGTSSIYLPNGLESLSDKLRYLEWHRYGLKSLPSTFNAKLLVELSMPYSNLQKLWDGVQNLVNLKEVDLRCCEELVEVPDLSIAKNLESLSLSECRSLGRVHPSILSLDNLQYLALEGCTNLESLKTKNHLKSLEFIQLNDCSSLKEFSVTSEKLRSLSLDGTAIKELPSSIWCCPKLTRIDLHGCDNLVGFGDNLPDNIDMGIGSLETLVLSGCKQLNASNLCFNLKAVKCSLKSLYLENCCNLEALPDSIDLLSSLQCLKLSGSNVEILSSNIKNLNNLKELRLDNCTKLVYVPELPSSLRLFSAINCTSLLTDLTILDIPFEHRPKPQPYPQSVFFPGAHVPKRFSFCSQGNNQAITSIRHLPDFGLYGFVFCIVVSQSNEKYGNVQCSVYQNSKRIGIKATTLGNLHLVMDHVFLWYLDIRTGSAHISLHGQIQKSGAWDDPYNISFQFSLENEEGEWSTERIMGCGVFPLYHLEQSNNQKEINELQVTTINGSNHRNEEDQTKVLHQTIATLMQDEKLDSNQTYSSHIFVDPTANDFKGKQPRFEEQDCYTNTSSIPINQTIEVMSEEKYLTNNELVMLERVHTLETDSWDPFSELESLLGDNYNLSPMSTDSTTVSILENLETLLETPLEILSSDKNMKQQFHHILEQLGKFENQIPVRLHHVICKLRTFIEGVDVRFFSVQNTIQDYDQLLQSRSLILKKVESAKVRQYQINSEISQGKTQFERINSEIFELEQKLSGLIEIREKVKKELEHCDVKKCELNAEVAQWVPECKSVQINLKNSENSYKVALTNKKKVEDEWFDLKRTFAANKF